MGKTTIAAAVALYLVAGVVAEATTLDDMCLKEDFAHLADSVYNPDSIWVTGGDCDSVSFTTIWKSPTTGTRAALDGTATPLSSCRLLLRFFIAGTGQQLFDTTMFVCSDPDPETLEDVCLANDFAILADSLYDPDSVWVTGGDCDSVTFRTIWTSPTTGGTAHLDGIAVKADPCSLDARFFMNAGQQLVPLFDTTFFVCGGSVRAAALHANVRPSRASIMAVDAGVGRTLFLYRLPVRSGGAVMTITDLRGRVVRRLALPDVSRGSMLWTGTGAGGGALSPGTYICCIRSAGHEVRDAFAHN